MKKIFKTILVVGIVILSGTSCDDFLDQSPNNILVEDEVFGDPNMIQSVLANYYNRVRWGQHIDANWEYIYLDEAGPSNGGPNYFQTFGDAHWRVYDYGLIRNINQFLEGANSAAAADLTDAERNQIIGEARFLRAWTYFNMVRCLGGVPVVGDEVFGYEDGMDVNTLQFPRATEAETYDYIISECTEIAELLTPDHTVNSSRANKWAALSLKARAAIYAASLAKYNNLMENPIKTSGNEVGISADLADGYYDIALKTAETIIADSGYGLHDVNPDKGVNFYEATSIKDNNNEVIWATEYIYPGHPTQFTTLNIPLSVREDLDGTVVTPILNLVEDFEYIDDRDGTLKTTDEGGNYIFYENAEDIFDEKDPRLYGTVIYPGAPFRGTEIVMQAGRKFMEGGDWKNEIAGRGETDGDGDLITSINGPTTTNDLNVNKSGFHIRKFMDADLGSATRGSGSDMWFVNFRFAEILLIASEAAMEMGMQDKALGYINQVRQRAGIQDLTSVTLSDIVQERRVEFAFENHRFWDLKRWRIAHEVWNGIDGDPEATQYALFPYRVNLPGQPEDGMWVFDKQKLHTSVYPRYFQMRNYYNTIDQGWINSNPKLVKNPFQ